MRVADNQHSIDIGARLTFRVIAHTDARRRRRRRSNVSGVHVLNNPLIQMREEEEVLQGRFSAYSQ
jgi:hypothetical protein